MQKGDLLFTLDMEELQTKIAQMEQEIHKYDLQIADMKHDSQAQADLQNFYVGGTVEGDGNVPIVTPDQANEAVTGSGSGDLGLGSGAQE